MTVKTQKFGAGHFMISDPAANAHYAVEEITIAAGEVLSAGAVLAKNSVTGQYVSYDNDETTTEDDAAAILWDHVDATDAATKATALVRGPAVVNGDELIFGDTEDTGDREAAVADLKAVGILCRFGINPGEPFNTNE